MKEVRSKLAPFSGLHLTPYAWLHMTALIAGPANQISDQQVQQMATTTSRRLATISPITVTVGKILFHPEAIMLAVRPAEALLPVLEAAQEATQEVTGSSGRSGNKLPWAPHITIAHSTTQQPAEPIITAIGRSLSERNAQISTITLVNQHGPNLAGTGTPKRPSGSELHRDPFERVDRLP
jgi:2'-5' RNA ligase